MALQADLLCILGHLFLLLNIDRLASESHLIRKKLNENKTQRNHLNRTFAFNNFRVSF
jgi:hypothetical protein